MSSKSKDWISSGKLKEGKFKLSIVN